jgi:hypothetical protein
MARLLRLVLRLLLEADLPSPELESLTCAQQEAEETIQPELSAIPQSRMQPHKRRGILGREFSNWAREVFQFQTFQTALVLSKMFLSGVLGKN